MLLACARRGRIDRPPYSPIPLPSPPLPLAAATPNDETGPRCSRAGDVGDRVPSTNQRLRLRWRRGSAGIPRFRIRGETRQFCFFLSPVVQFDASRLLNSSRDKNESKYRSGQGEEELAM